MLEPGKTIRIVLFFPSSPFKPNIVVVEETEYKGNILILILYFFFNPLCLFILPYIGSASQIT